MTPGYPPGSRVTSFGTWRRGTRILLLHLPAAMELELGLARQRVRLDRLHDDEVRKVLDLPPTVLIVRHPEWPATTPERPQTEEGP